MNNKGFTLLLAVITTSIMLIISFVVTNVAFKQILLSHSMRESQFAFYAADAGTECAVYWDLKNTTSAFSTSTGGSIVCSGMTIDNGANAQTMPTYPVASMIGGGGSSNPTSTFTLTFPTGCAIVRVGKHPDGTTLIDSRGYNSCNTASSKRYERGVTLRFDNGSYLGGNGNIPTSPTLSTDVSSVASGGSLNVSWTNISSIAGNPQTTDWIALYPVNSGSDLSYVANSGIYAGSCAAASSIPPGSSGTCGFNIPNGTPVGTYYLMMLDKVPTNGGSQVAIAATPNITVTNAITGHIALSPTSLTFTAATNATPAGKTVVLQNTGTGTLSWTASASQTWCHVSPASGSLAASASINLTVTVDSRSTIGTYNCNIIVNSTTADNSPQTVAVTFNVTSAYACATASGSVNNANGVTSGNYKIFIFTGNGTLSVTCAGTIEYLVVGGGGGGALGGGGGGGVLHGTDSVPIGNYGVIVGGGGASGNDIPGGTPSGANGGNGGNSSYNGHTALGGGGGGGGSSSGLSAGSGGGGGAGGSGGTGNVSQGKNGGSGINWGGDWAGGGGGGASTNGSAGYNNGGGNGGTGVTYSISGASTVYGGGGGGGAGNSPGVGGAGGGGNAGPYVFQAGSPGTANTGGGGGGTYGGTGGSGGSGIVIIKFQFQ